MKDWRSASVPWRDRFSTSQFLAQPQKPKTRAQSVAERVDHFDIEFAIYARPNYTHPTVNPYVTQPPEIQETERRKSFGRRIVETVGDMNLIILAGFIQSIGAKLNTSVFPSLNLYLVEKQYPGLTTAQYSSEAAKWSSYQSICENIFAVFLVAVFGGLSDRYGRKPIMILHNSILIMSYGFFVLCAEFEPPVIFLLIPYAARGWAASGGFMTTLVLAYISDKTIHDDERKVKKFGQYFACNYFAGAIGPYTGGLLFDKLGEEASFYFAMGLTVIALLIIFCCKESLREEYRAKSLKLKNLNLFHVLGALLQNYSFALMAFVFVICSCLVFGMNSIFVYYMQYKFMYSATTTGLFLTVMSLYSSLAILLIFPMAKKLISHFQNEKDGWILMTINRISLFGAISSMVLFAFAPEGWMFFAIGALYGFSAGMDPGIRALFSASVPPDQQGKVLSALSATKKLQQVALKPALEATYSQTVTIYAPMTFLVIGAGAVVAMFCTFLVKREHFKKPEERKKLLAESIDLECAETSEPIKKPNVGKT